MVTINTLTRDLMIKANNYQAQFGTAPTIRNLWVTPSFYEYMCQQFQQRGDSYQGYSIKLMTESSIPYRIDLQ